MTGKRPSPAMVISVVALLAALGGTAIAAGLAKNSVKSKQIKNGQVKNPDLKGGAVDASKVAADSLTGAEVNEGTLSGVPIADAAVTGSKLAPGSVTSDKFAINATATIDFPNLPQWTCTSSIQDTGVLTQVQLGDQVIVTAPENKPTGVMITAGTFDTNPPGVFVDACAISGAIDPPPGEYEFTVIR